MKKRFALLMAVLLCGAMLSMPALAELGTVQGTLQTYQPISNVDFDDSYYGFCLIEDRRAAAPGDKFTIAETKDNAKNKEGKDISNALKVLVVEYFDHFFIYNGDYNTDTPGNYKMHYTKARNFQSAVYRLADGTHNTSEDIIAIVNDVLEKAKTMTIDDSGYVKTLSNGTKVVFDFKVFKTKQGEVDGKLQQDFIGFKVMNKPAGEDLNPDGPNPDDPNPDDPNPDDPNPDDPNPDDPDPDDPNPDDPNPDDPNPDDPDLDDVVRQLPKTGDNTSLTLWALMMAGCLTALTALNRRAKRRN